MSDEADAMSRQASEDAELIGHKQDAEDAVIEELTMPPDRKDHTIEEWDELILAEEKKWDILGINLMQMTFTGFELFQMQCKIQALINCAIQDDHSEENMLLNLKMVILETEQQIRASIEPQVQAAKIAALKQGMPLPPGIAKPWERGGNGGS